jgi:hypothetical protein
MGMGDFSSMLWWLPRRRERIISIDAEAEALISGLGFDAYDEARRREIEASSDAIARDWDRVAQAIAQKTSAGPNAPIQTSPDTDFVSDRKSAGGTSNSAQFGAKFARPTERSHLGEAPAIQRPIRSRWTGARAINVEGSRTAGEGFVGRNRRGRKFHVPADDKWAAHH